MPNDEVSDRIGLYAMEESDYSELNWFNRNVPSKRGDLYCVEWGVKLYTVFLLL